MILSSRIKFKWLACLFFFTFATNSSCLGSLTATTVFEVQAGAGASDTLNSGGFDTASTGKLTNLTTDANTANTASPIVSSASYNFVAQDVNNWLHIQAGTSWTPGWYKITAVGSNKATLSAAIGAAILANFTASTAVGCATVGTPTSGTFAVDYSQVAGVQFSLTGLTTAAANAIILTASATKAMVGNLIQITGGTNFTTGFYVVQACTAGVSLTVDRNCTTAAGLAGTAGIGGALASPGQAFAVAVASNSVLVKSGTYSITSTTNNVAGGRITTSGNQMVMGYGTLRGDLGTSPVLQASGIATTVIVTGGGATVNIKVDGASLTSIQGFLGSGGNGQYFYKCTGINCTNSAFSNAASSPCIQCYASACTTVVAFTGVSFWGCVADSCTAGGFNISNNAGIGAEFCIASNNTGIGFQMGQGGIITNSTAYNNSTDGFKSPATGPWRVQIINCIGAKNGGYQFNLLGNFTGPYWGILISCAAWNSGGTGTFNGTNTQFQAGTITLTSDPFVLASAGNFKLNNTSGGGRSCRHAGIPGVYPGLALTRSYQDIGSTQHSDLVINGRGR